VLGIVRSFWQQDAKKHRLCFFPPFGVYKKQIPTGCHVVESGALYWICWIWIAHWCCWFSQ
jgi:hypothetical protein